MIGLFNRGTRYLSAAAGRDQKASVRVASTGNIAIATDLIDGSVVDGVTLATGNRAFLWKQTKGEENGIYLVVASGAAPRTIDTDTSEKVTSGMNVFVSEGTVARNNGYTLLTKDPIVLGTTVLEFTQVSGAAAITPAQMKIKTLVALADAAATLTAAQIVDSGIFTITPTVARTLTTDTAVAIIAALPRYQVGTWFDFTILNLAAFNVSLAGGTGVTLSGATLIIKEAGTWKVNVTSATTVTMHNSSTIELLGIAPNKVAIKTPYVCIYDHGTYDQTVYDF